MAFKLLLSAEKCWRRVNAPHAVCWIAQLGDFLGCKFDGEPGVTISGWDELRLSLYIVYSLSPCTILRICCQLLA